MIPFGLSKEQFQTRYRRCLELASQHLIDELRKLFSISVPNSVKDAEVQIFLGEDGLDIPTAWIYYRGENNKVDHSDLSIFPGRAMELSVGLENIEPFDERYFSDEEFNGLTLAANIIKYWFAGGKLEVGVTLFQLKYGYMMGSVMAKQWNSRRTANNWFKSFASLTGTG